MEKPWYRNGLRFECLRCGNCCRGVPGHVWVTHREIARLAQRLDMKISDFRAHYTRRAREQGKSGISLTENSNYDCIFYDAERGCRVYEDRPRQCRTWPFWRTVVVSPATWEDEAQRCPGMDRGPLHSAEEITRASEDDGLP